MILTKLPTPEVVLLSLELQVMDLPTLYVHLDFLTLKARYYYFHFKSDTSKLTSIENKTAVKDSIIRTGTSVYLTRNTHSF